MTEGIILTGPHKNFEDIKKVDENGAEYWGARDLMPLLGYERWENFTNTISRAAKACANAGEDIGNHFRDATKMVFRIITC